MTFDESVKRLTREERFMATVSAMSTLLIEKGVFAQEEFERYFLQWAEAEIKKPSRGYVKVYG